MANQIRLVLGAAGDSADNVVFVGGTKFFSRVDWLSTDLDVVAQATAKLCRDLDVDPVVRVGSSPNGYGSLKVKSGVTDAPSPIPNFPWDVFQARLLKAFNAPVVVVDEAPVLDEKVKEKAKKGDDEALTKVIAVAAEGDAEEAEEAKDVLADVPASELEAWNKSHLKDGE